MKPLTIAIALLAASAVSARAEFIDGNKLLHDCKKQGAGGQMFCMGFVGGIADHLTMILRAFYNSSCVPNGVTLGQAQDVATRYLRDHPETRHKSAAVLVSAALVEAWCPSDSPSVSHIPEQEPQWKKVPAPVPANRKSGKPLPLDTE
jgi:hypothetical protein